jgi:3-oxoacyl-[acyl-carrier protein] reductase
MKSLSREVAADQITVNSILPGYTLTKRMEEWKGGLDRLIADVPAGRLAEPWEIGALAAFLSSTKAAYLTGQAIACDGGLIRGV